MKSFLVASCVPLLLLACVTAWIGANSLIYEAGRRKSEVAYRIGEAVSHHLEEVGDWISSFDKDFDIRRSPAPELKRQLARMLGERPDFQSLAIVENDHTVSAHVDRDRLLLSAGFVNPTIAKMIEETRKTQTPEFWSAYLYQRDRPSAFCN